ncbi:Superkiller protein 3 [Spathaspora sp. JA1]|nr:Superkiller protein 3 [Spathaspora sp. JA1]
MSSLKKLLKSAKVAIEKNDPESALEYADEAIELDSNCYFAYLFKGKAHQLLRDIPNAITQFKRASEIEPENLLAWKGYFQTVRASDDYQLFFSVLTKLITLQLDQELGIGETLRDLYNYLDLNKYKSNDKLNELYLKSIIPGSELGELIGSQLRTSPEVNVRNLLDFKKAQLDKQVQTRLSKERVKFGRNLTVEQKSTLDSIAWEYYKDGQLTNLYQVFLNICNDDELRVKYQDDFLKYRYDILKICPEKTELFTEIKQTIEDMILVNTTSLFCWNLYFDWCDIKTIFELDEDKIIGYLRIFQNQGLGLILFAFVMSEISPYNKEKIIEGISYKKKPEKKREKLDEEDIAELQGDEPDEDFSQYFLPPDEILGYILEGYSKAKDSILANRIIVNYYIHLREYDTASERCRDGIKLLAEVQRSFGIDLSNTKEDFLCSLAIVYTYYEAPKNFNRALQLYDKILETNEGNIKAKVGRGLIFAEQGDLPQAKLILEQVLQQHPDNSEAELEYNWCLINLGQFEQGKLGLEKFIGKVTGTDLYSGEIRAKAQWRIAKGYYMQGETDKENINQCYAHLIQSLKDSESFAPSYTLLGVLFHDYYRDSEKAQKCFFKAFDLDVNEIVSAKYLVENATANNEWDVALVLAKRVINNESSRRLVLRPAADQDNSWPYRVLGCGALNIQDDAKAVEYFQNALRINAQDFQCWIGLGEAYYNCGRFDAAAKVFLHAIDMKEDIPWTVKYLLGVVTCEMKEFDQGLTYLYEALASQPEEQCIITAIYEAHLENTGKYIQAGFFGRAIDSSLQGFEFIKKSILNNLNSPKIWKSLGDCLNVFLKIQSYIEKVPMDEIVEIFKHISVDDITVDAALDDSISLTNAIELFKTKKVESLAILNILCCKAGVKYLPSSGNKYLRSTALYNLALALLQGYQINQQDSLRQCSITLFKKAIQLENNNANYWLGLGNAYFYNNPQISQHCYIKATTLEVKDGGIWINLATLFLKYGDLELSQHAYLRAQSVAHQDSQAWLGQAIAFEILGDKTKAYNYYSHAFTLSKGKLAVAQFLYGLSVINKRVGQGFDPRDVETAQEFGTSNQAMQQYLKYKPNDEDALAIALTIAERCKDFEMAIKLGDQLCTILEAKYQETEQESVLENFSLIKSQIARVHLGLGDYTNSLECAQMALQLIEGQDANSKIVLSCHITIGLSYFFNNEFELAIQELKLILTQSTSSPRIVTLIAQILYAHGTEESKQASIDQLFANIEENGSSLLVVLTLGAISLVENYQEYLEPIKEELQGLSLAELVEDNFRDVPRLLDEINTRLTGNKDNSIWLRYAYLFPFDYNVWKNVNHQMAKTVITLQDVKVNGVQYSQALLDSGSVRDIQRSLMLTPGNQVAIEALQKLIT